MSASMLSIYPAIVFTSSSDLSSTARACSWLSFFRRASSTGTVGSASRTGSTGSSAENSNPIGHPRRCAARIYISGARKKT